MKNDLQIKKYKTIPVKGTFNLIEEKTFFGTKLMDIEDCIEITTESIQYFQLSNSAYTQNLGYGYQYYTLDNSITNEELFIMDLVKGKEENHKIEKMLQKKEDDKYNTKWELEIDIKSILMDYLFGKIKNARTFRSLNYSDFSNNNINETIYEYIEKNILDRYKFDKVELFIKYIEIDNNKIYNSFTSKQYDPTYNQTVGVEEYKVTNINMKTNLLLNKLVPITVNYFQIKSGLEYKFDYYFNIHYKKI